MWEHLNAQLYMIHVKLKKINYKHIWVDINQVNINYENRSKDWICLYLGKLDERILIKLNLYLNFKTRTMTQQCCSMIAYAKTRLTQQEQVETDLKRGNYGRIYIAGT